MFEVLSQGCHGSLFCESEEFRNAFSNFDFKSQDLGKDIDRLLSDAGIIRHNGEISHRQQCKSSLSDHRTTRIAG